MKLNDVVLKKDEEAVFLLRSLFERYGYTQFKMNKFEEYDLYVQNKDFLISEGIITFTDTNGKLLALKPDVTLSIIKNSMQSSSLQKLYYDENVYRVSSGTNSFKEIMQVGVECIGDVDDYCLYEVLSLAAQSLKTLSDRVILDVSHFGMLSDLIDSCGVSRAQKKEILHAIGEKSLHEMTRACKRAGVSNDMIALLSELVSIYGDPEIVLPKLLRSFAGTKWEQSLQLLKSLCAKLKERGYGDVIRIDFSVINHTDYYNGIVFKGFIHGIPAGVLSGGQYDRLMERMGHNSHAIGFAIYLDLLENLNDSKKEYDVDALLLYREQDGFDAVENAVNTLKGMCASVSAQKTLPDGLRFRQLYQISENGVTLIERNA